MAATLSKPGDDVAEDHGLLTLKAIRGIDCVTVQVSCGPGRVDALTKTFPLDRTAAARIWWKTIAGLADTRIPVRRIEAAMTALTDAAVAAHLPEVSR